jgi:hypothetical protein
MRDTEAHLGNPAFAYINKPITLGPRIAASGVLRSSFALMTDLTHSPCRPCSSHIMKMRTGRSHSASAESRSSGLRTRRIVQVYTANRRITCSGCMLVVIDGCKIVLTPHIISDIIQVRPALPRSTCVSYDWPSQEPHATYRLYDQKPTQPRKCTRQSLNAKIQG